DASPQAEMSAYLRALSFGDEPVLAVIEHEDEWFALVRVDGDEEPRLFVSDLYTASHRHYGPLLAPAAHVDTAHQGADDDDADDDKDDDGETEDEDEEPKVAAWAG